MAGASRHASPAPASRVIVLLGVACLGVGFLAAAPVRSAPTFDTAALIPDASSFFANGLFPDKVGASAVFAKYGQNAWATGGGFAYTPAPTFLGIDTGNLSDSLGGFASECIFGECAYFGAKVSASGRATAGVEYNLTLQGGTLDIRYPVQVTLDLPYGPGGTNVPRVGEPFKIGSSWSIQLPIYLPGGGSGGAALAPLLAAHGPQLASYVDLVGALRASVKGELCFIACVGPFGPGFDEGGTWEIAAANRGGDGQVRALGQGVSPAQPGELAGGVIQYYVNVPTLDAKGALGADLKTLAAQTSDKVIGLGIGIDELIASLLGLPPLSDSFGLSIAGKHFGAGYNLLDAGAWLNLLLAQSLGFTASPMVDLEFSGNVRVRQQDGTFGPPTKTVSFAAGDTIELLAADSQLLGVVPTVRLLGTASNKTDLTLAGEVSLTALGVTSTLGNIGPLFSDTLDLSLGSTLIHDHSFAVDFAAVTGGAFNMAFRPPLEPVSLNDGSIVLTFWDSGQWRAAGCAGLAECAFLPQSKVIGFYDLVERDPLLACLQRADGCDPAEILRLVDFTRFHDRFFGSNPRLLGDGGGDLFLSDLLALSEPSLDVQPDLDPAEEARSRAALRLAFGPQPFVVPPAPLPEPGSLALAAIALAAAIAVGAARDARGHQPFA